MEPQWIAHVEGSDSRYRKPTTTAGDPKSSQGADEPIQRELSDARIFDPRAADQREIPHRAAETELRPMQYMTQPGTPQRRRAPLKAT